MTEATRKFHTHVGCHAEIQVLITLQIELKLMISLSPRSGHWIPVQNKIQHCYHSPENQELAVEFVLSW